MCKCVFMGDHLSFCEIPWNQLYLSFLCVCVSECMCVCVDPETAGGWREKQVFCTLRVYRYSLRLIPQCHGKVASTQRNPGRSFVPVFPILPSMMIACLAHSQNIPGFLIPEWSRAMCDTVGIASFNPLPSAWLS